MRANYLKLSGAMLGAIVSLSTIGMPVPVQAETEIIEKNASIVVNGWHIKADEIVRHENGVIKAWGNAHASHDGHHCMGSAERITLNTNAGRISFVGSPRVNVDGVKHVAEGDAGLRFDFKRHEVESFRD